MREMMRPENRDFKDEDKEPRLASVSASLAEPSPKKDLADGRLLRKRSLRPLVSAIFALLMFSFAVPPITLKPLSPGPEPSMIVRVPVVSQPPALVLASGKELLEEAIQMAKKMADEDPARRGVLAEVLREVAKVDPMRALALAQEGASEGAFAGVRAHIAGELARSDPVAALKVAESLKDTPYFEKALTAIAVTVAETDPEKAILLGRRLKTENRRDNLTAAVVHHLIQIDPAIALQFVSKIKNSAYRDEALGAIVSALAEVDAGAAREVAGTITDDYWRGMSLAAVARTVNATDPTEAARLTDEVLALAEKLGEREQNRLKAEAASLLVGVDFPRALQIAERLKPVDLQDAVYVELTRALALRDLNAALEFSDKIVSPYERALFLKDLALRVGIDNPEAALPFIHRINDPDVQNLAIADLAVSIADRDPHQAEEILRDLNDAEMRAEAVSRIEARKARKNLEDILAKMLQPVPEASGGAISEAEGASQTAELSAPTPSSSLEGRLITGVAQDAYRALALLDFMVNIWKPMTSGEDTFETPEDVENVLRLARAIAERDPESGMILFARLAQAARDLKDPVLLAQIAVAMLRTTPGSATADRVSFVLPHSKSSPKSEASSAPKPTEEETLQEKPEEKPEQPPPKDSSRKPEKPKKPQPPESPGFPQLP